MDLSAMIQFHEARGAVCTLAMSTTVPSEYGVARVNEDGRVTYFEEKPVLKEYPVSMGIDIMEREALSYCKPNTDIAKDVISKLVEENRPVYAYLTEKRHYDIGTFKTLEEVRELIEKGSLF
jgi:NDP-sugar pyrophosphorylase family protein